MKNTLIIIVLLLSSLALTAQERNKTTTNEKIRTEKVGFFTQNLSLTTNEAQNFWPIYDEYDNKQRHINKQLKELSKKLLNEQLSLQQLEKADVRFVQLKKAQNELFFSYHSKFKTVLGTEKTLKLYHTEIQFRSYLLKQLRGNQSRGRRN